MGRRIEEDITVYAHSLFVPFCFFSGKLVEMSSEYLVVQIPKIYEEEVLMYRKYVIHFERGDNDVVVILGVSSECCELEDGQELHFRIMHASDEHQQVLQALGG